ncbi:hypothetical protein [Ruminococcus sp.]|uniref:hypothetical protein n=1 Tax=Ruminococcus sp. TaxID=41978 RepID=UPI002E817079|nr:hypothetical protein [Ruminococcus sp.]MEE3439129.1 hypothetical protein [Ruminococcus sp.]
MSKILSKVVDTLLVFILLFSIENLTLTTFKFPVDLCLLGVVTIVSIVLAEVICCLKKNLKIISFYFYFVMLSLLFYIGKELSKTEVFVTLAICSAFAFLFTVLIDYFKFIKVSVFLLVTLLFVDIFMCKKIDKLTVFIFFSALVVLCITAVCKKHNKNYFWITLAVSLAVTLLFVSVVNIYPEKTETKNIIQYVTTGPQNTNTTVATKTNGNYTTTIKSSINTNKNNMKGAAKNVETVVRPFIAYTTTVANTKSTNKVNNKQDNIKVENYATKVVNIIMVTLVVLLSLIIIFALVIILRYKLKKKFDKKKYSSLTEKEKCIYYFNKISAMNVKINKEINNVLNKIQFSENGATEVESEILKDYYTSNKELKLKNSNFFKRIFLKYLKMI